MTLCRKGVPTVKNTTLLSEPCGWPLSAAALGTSAPAGGPAPLTSAGGAFAAARPTLHRPTMAAVQLATCEMYQKKTRIAANGGDQSGPHPAWDPV